MTISSEVLAGLIFLVFGAVAVVVGWGYGVGNVTQLGSGAMPVLVGGALCVLGTAQLLRALIAEGAGARVESAFKRGEVRPLLFVLGAVLAFGLLAIPLGLVPALAVLILTGWFAESGPRQRWELPAVLLAVSLLVVLIFHFGLGIPFRLFAWGL